MTIPVTRLQAAVVVAGVLDEAFRTRGGQHTAAVRLPVHWRQYEEPGQPFALAGPAGALPPASETLPRAPGPRCPWATMPFTAGIRTAGLSGRCLMKTAADELRFSLRKRLSQAEPPP
jgi:hypothetical protein